MSAAPTPGLDGGGANPITKKLLWYLDRATELETAKFFTMAYYLRYYCVEKLMLFRQGQGTLCGPNQAQPTPEQQNECQMLLLTLVENLEKLKGRAREVGKEIGGREQRTSDRAAVETFVKGVFHQADNTDRGGFAGEGGAVDATTGQLSLTPVLEAKWRKLARDWMFAGKFLDILEQFDERPAGANSLASGRLEGAVWGEDGDRETAPATAVGSKYEEKRRYCRYKSTYIIKTLKSGQAPAPGPPGWDGTDGPGPDGGDAQTTNGTGQAGSASAAGAKTAATEAGLEAELAALMAQEAGGSGSPAPGGVSSAQDASAPPLVIEPTAVAAPPGSDAPTAPPAAAGPGGDMEATMAEARALLEGNTAVPQPISPTGGVTGPALAAQLAAMAKGSALDPTPNSNSTAPVANAVVLGQPANAASVAAPSPVSPTRSVNPSKKKHVSSFAAKKKCKEKMKTAAECLDFNDAAGARQMLMEAIQELEGL